MSASAEAVSLVANDIRASYPDMTDAEAIEHVLNTITSKEVLSGTEWLHPRDATLGNAYLEVLRQTTLQPGERVTVDDFGVPRACVAETMPRVAAFRPEEWHPERLYLRDVDGRYFPADSPRWEGK